MLKFHLILITALLCFGRGLMAQDLKNPLVLDNEWSGYSIGDPYVLKHRGVFYLYCSTKDSETGVKCWSSRDLVHWEYEGLCSTDAVTRGAYAPEVIYWNGTFYMYTSPAGNGHYVLSAPSPTGPFEPVTGNLGKSIDGSVFIDDNAGMFFYHASSGGIQGCSMPSPTSFGVSSSMGVQMNKGWTEGPCLFKRNGIYYLIYTGNHVISKGYRIDYATNRTGPVELFTPATHQNPILLDALGLHTGLGHGSVFIGPDLDSYYLTYHNLVSGTGPFRRLNFDRIAWNSDKMVLLGPTVFVQQNPALPDVYDYFDRDDLDSSWILPTGGSWYINENEILVQDSATEGGNDWFLAIRDSTTGNEYTAEFNLRETFRENEEGKLGVVFGYTDEENYSVAWLSSSTNQLKINVLEGNSWGTPRVTDLYSDFDCSQWHSLRIEKYLDRYRFFVDGRLKDSIENGLGAGKIGYLTGNCHGEFSFIAFSNRVNGSGTFNVPKPVPGQLPAVQYNQGGEGTGFHRENPSGSPVRILRSDEVDLTPSSLGGYALSSLQAGDWFNYMINVELDRLYNTSIMYASGQEVCKIRFLLNGSDISGPVGLPPTGGSNQWRSWVVKDLELPQGSHILTMEVLEGGFDFYSMEFVKADNVAFDKTVNFDGAFGTGWKYEDGAWRILDKVAVIDGFGKRTYGSDSWCDYTVETDLMFTRSMNAGLILRVNNPALGGAGNDPALGTDYLQGYFVGFNFGSVVLGKHNYGWQSMTTAPGSFSMNTWYHLRAVVEGDRIRVFVDDMTQPVIDYTDPLPLINGMAGLRSFNTGVKFDNFHVTSHLLTTSVEGHTDPDPYPQVRIYPNPAAGVVTIDFAREALRSIGLLDISGRSLFSKTSGAERIEIPVIDLEPGIYILQVESGPEVQVHRLVVQ